MSDLCLYQSVENQIPFYVSPTWIRARFLRRLNEECLLVLKGLDSKLSKSLPPDLQKLQCKVLDEIHRQPMLLSLSMISLPAPESVVDSFPEKTHRKPEKPESGDDKQQCYICLAEYEEGDKIRVLPCHHEYHVACVDKWLKEIHGVCPLYWGMFTKVSQKALFRTQKLLFSTFCIYVYQVLLYSP